MKPLQARIILLLILLLLLLLLLPLTAAPLHAGTIERLADLDSQFGGRAGFLSDRWGTALGKVGTGANERLLACLGGDRASLWTFGTTPESAQPIGGACPNGNAVVALAGDGGAATLLYTAAPYYAFTDEVWRTDGTRDGTYVLLPRSPTPAPPPTIVPRGRTAFLFFGGRLLETDGTVAGTREVATFEGSFLSAATVGDTVVFVSGVGNYAVDLWRTDGTSAGTRRLAHVNDYSYVDPLLKSGDRVFVLLLGSLWVTDGSEAGTRPVVASFYDQHVSPRALQMVAYRGGIAFEADSDVPPSNPPPREVWWSDGTAAGTRRLARLPSNQLYSLQRFRVVGSRLLFTVESTLWTSDGTERGTAPLSGCRGGCPRVYGLYGVELHGALLFGAADDRRGFELWRTDGTGRGTRTLREVCPGPCGSLVTSPVPWRGGVAYLAAEHPFQNAALWSSDGTHRGTVRLAGVGAIIDPGNGPVEAGGRLYEMLYRYDIGWQLWTLDGTPAGTLPLTRQVGSPRADSLRGSWARTDGGVFVAARGLLASDGTRGGTHRVPETDDLNFLSTLGDVGIAQRVGDDGTVELLRVPADGGEPTPIVALPAGHWIQATIPFRGALALDVQCGCGSGHADELWVTDGTAAGTTRRMTFPNTEARFLAVDGDSLYFATAGTGTGSGGGTILWRSDGTESGTLALVQRPQFGGQLVRAGAELFFVAAGRSFGPELWRTDGTPAGTRPYFDDGGPPAPRGLFAFDGALFLASADDEECEGHGKDSVWRVDPATHQLDEIASFSNVGGGAWTFAAAGDHLFFAAGQTPLGGSALYASDGTAAGTMRVAALTPPGDLVYPSLPPPVALGDELLFTALDLLHGSEPWKSDGTVAGTRLLRDLEPGSQGSLPLGWVAAGNRAFFAAGDGMRAAGLFVYDPTRPACASNGERVCLGGRFEAEAVFPPSDYYADVPTAAALSIGPASELFTHPTSGEPRLALRASTATGGASVAVAGLTHEWWIATVTDTTSGEARSYVSLPGLAVRFDDRAAFADDKGTAVGPRPAARPILAKTRGASSHAPVQADVAPCSPDATTACLLAGRFSVRGHRGDQPAALAATGDEVALIAWPPESAGTSAVVGTDVDPDAVVRVAPLGNGGHEAFFAALAPTQGAAVVRDDSGRSAVYPNLAGTLTLVDDPTTFAPPP